MLCPVCSRDQLIPSLPTGLQACQLALSTRTVWARCPNGDLARRYGITDKNAAGDYWKKIPGSVSCLTGRCWGLADSVYPRGGGAYVKNLPEPRSRPTCGRARHGSWESPDRNRMLHCLEETAGAGTYTCDPST